MLKLTTLKLKKLVLIFVVLFVAYACEKKLENRKTAVVEKALVPGSKHKTPGGWRVAPTAEQVQKITEYLQDPDKNQDTLLLRCVSGEEMKKNCIPGRKCPPAMISASSYALEKIMNPSPQILPNTFIPICELDSPCPKSTAAEDFMSACVKQKSFGLGVKFNERRIAKFTKMLAGRNIKNSMPHLIRAQRLREGSGRITRKPGQAFVDAGGFIADSKEQLGSGLPADFIIRDLAGDVDALLAATKA